MIGTDHHHTNQRSNNNNHWRSYDSSWMNNDKNPSLSDPNNSTLYKNENNNDVTLNDSLVEKNNEDKHPQGDNNNKNFKFFRTFSSDEETEAGSVVLAADFHPPFVKVEELSDVPLAFDVEPEPDEMLLSSSVDEIVAAIRKRGQRNRRQSINSHGHNNNNYDANDDDEEEDVELTQRLNDFQRARLLRKARGERSMISSGLFGLLYHLADVRLDLEWAEDAAWRRANHKPYVSWTDYESAHGRAVGRFPFFTFLILLSSTAMMIYEIEVNGWKLEPFRTNPMLGASAQVLFDIGALHTQAIVGPAQEWYRLFLPMIMHAGLIHYCFNMIAISLIGGVIEQVYGLVNVGLIFIIASVGGNILSAAFQPFAITVGASGGIFGLIGVCLADIFMNWDLVFIDVENNKNNNNEEEEGSTTAENNDKGLVSTNAFTRVVVILLVEMAVNIMIGLTPFIDNFANLGGLFYGTCCAFPLMDRVGKDFFGPIGICGNIRICSIRLLGISLSLLLVIISVAILVSSDGVTVPCRQCLYISCAPFPFWTDSKWWECYYDVF